jgi:3-methyladenine DNA glycosylase AlkD
VLGLSFWRLHRIAKETGPDHALAQALWRSGIHEARLLAALVEEPDRVTERQLERWARAFDSWDVVDTVSALVARTPLARRMIRRWAGRPEEFVRRAAFAMIAELAWHEPRLSDGDVERFFRLIRTAAADERNFVRKAVSWALRNLGKRSPDLNRRAVRVARALHAMPSRSARWIGADALRELTGPAVQERVRRRLR